LRKAAQAGQLRLDIEGPVIYGSQAKLAPDVQALPRDLLLHVLDDDLVDAETARRYTHTMGANVRALGALVDDLFELSRR
jgi:hypothetical protein